VHLLLHDTHRFMPFADTPLSFAAALILLVALLGLLITIRRGRSARPRPGGPSAPISLDHLRQVLDAAPVGMLLVSHAGRIILANQELARIFGYGPDELSGLAVEALLPERFRARHPALRDGYFASPGVRRMGAGRDLFGRRRDGTDVPVDIGLTPIVTAVGPCVLASVSDTTVQRKAQADLRLLNARLQCKNADLERFVATASHDLKSPILTILAYSDHLATHLTDPELNHLAEFCRRISAAAIRLRNHIDAVLELSRLGADAHHARPVSLPAVTAEVWQALAEPEIRRDAVLTTDFRAPVAYLHPAHATQLLQNLIENALKHGCPSPGAVIHVGSCPTELGVRLFVQDHGPGVAPADRDRVFNLFSRLNTTTGGSGLGLALVRRIAELRGGSAHIEETPGGGATLVVDLPSPAPCHHAPDPTARGAFVVTGPAPIPAPVPAPVGPPAAH
jgi:PAS domain S-box-containing protein